MTIFRSCLVVLFWLTLSTLSAQAVEGEASFYADKFEGRPTASGEKYRRNEFTAAHRNLPFGTVVRVTNLENGREVVVRINDRGPFVKGRIIDLSRAAAEALGFIQDGIARVRVEQISEGRVEQYFSGNGESFIPSGWSLQLASFSQKSNAAGFMKAMAAQFSDPIFMEVNEKNNIPYYRILIGPFSSKSQALSKKDEIAGSFPTALLREHPEKN